jgi:hypothetical protein
MVYTARVLLICGRIEVKLKSQFPFALKYTRSKFLKPNVLSSQNTLHYGYELFQLKFRINNKIYKKGKAIPVTGRGGP